MHQFNIFSMTFHLHNVLHMKLIDFSSNLKIIDMNPQ